MPASARPAAPISHPLENLMIDAKAPPAKAGGAWCILLAVVLCAKICNDLVHFFVLEQISQ